MVKDNTLSELPGNAALLSGCAAAIFKNTVFVSVDDFRIFVFIITVKITAIIFVHMPVDEITGLVAVQQVAEGLKAPVGQVFPVVDIAGGSVGQQNVHAAVAHEGQRTFFGAALHFLLLVLIFSVVVIHGAAKTQNPDALVNVELVVHADAALRRFAFVLCIMVAVDVEYRGAGHGDQEGKILCTKISRRQDEVDVCQLLFLIIIPEVGRFDV